MQVEDPRRLVAFLLTVAVILGGVWYFVLRDSGSGQPAKPAAAKTKTATQQAATAAEAAPEDIKQVLDATVKQPHVQLTISGKGVPKQRRVLNTADELAAYYTNGKLVLLQRGRDLWAALPEKCFDHHAQPEGISVTSSFAQEFLPAGDGVTYKTATADGKTTITWDMEAPKDAPKGYAPPSGVVVADAGSHVMLSAAISSGGLTQKAQFTYPDRVDVPGKPTKVCDPADRAKRTPTTKRPPASEQPGA